MDVSRPDMGARAALVVGHEAAAGDPEPPRPIRLEGDADSRTRHDHLWVRHRRFEADRTIAQQIAAFLFGGKPEGCTEPAGSTSKIAIARPAAAGPRYLDAVDDLTGTQQDSGGVALRPADDIGCPMHPVTEVDVELSGRPEHDRVPGRAAAVGVRGRIRGSVVGLDLGQPDRHLAVPQRCPKQARRHLIDGASEVPAHGAESAWRVERSSTVPAVPSTRTRSPVFNRIVASPQPTTAGIPSSRATIAAWDNGAPTSVTTAAARGKSGVQPTLVTVVTNTSPDLNADPSTTSASTRTGASTMPEEPGKPEIVMPASAKGRSGYELGD